MIEIDNPRMKTTKAEIADILGSIMRNIHPGRSWTVKTEELTRICETALVAHRVYALLVSMEDRPQCESVIITLRELMLGG